MSDAIEPTHIQTGTEAAAPVGSNLPAAAASQPAPTFGGLINGIINFHTLTARFVALAAASALLKEHLHLLKAHMHRDADVARKAGELCGQAGADDYFVALYLETANDFNRVAEASGQLAGAADQMEADAQGVRDAHEAEYRGIYEAVQASPYRQPKPGFNRVR
jgi:hypothetical protein